MPREILVPTDGSPLSEDAFEHALGAFPDDDITLLHVVDSRYTGPDDDELHPERLFTSLVDIARQRGVEVRTETRVGRPSREIVAYSEESDVDEIVVGSHGRERASRILLGSVAERVLRRAPVPVTVVHPHQRRGDKHHVVAVDGSEQSTKAVEYAASTFPDVETTLVHAMDPMETYYGEGQLVYAEEEYERIETKAKELLADAREHAEAHGVTVTTTTVVEWGPNRPADAILDYVESNDVDHVFLGSHGRSGASRILFGSVAETVARRSPAPVTVVR
ncbi:hypothetical protein AUR64_10415 [Haloprofundus marisrubri]|uniref:UspA domain-containing protein n=1 Tax=Haloprofundus marisrubri TaxID=1514971 RepID=A0A0W1R8Y2_9EURY|nr:universal stress protein [Haloprofundus marisrubri]KTG10009.1 hypothetical protein AUR64_10415 [Haloprofundus marisrubri]